MKLQGIHHVTCITGDAPKNVDVLHRHARAADGQEDRQPGRPDRLPPLLRGRERLGRRRHHLLRVPRAIARPRGRRDGAPRRLPRRLRGVARLLGRSASAASAATARSSSHDPEGLALELVVDDVAATRRSSRGIPRSPRSTRCAASPACAPTRRARSAAPRSSRARLRRPGWVGSRGDRARGFYVYDDAAGRPRGIPGARHRAPRRVGVARSRSTRLAREACARRAASRRR